MKIRTIAVALSSTFATAVLFACSDSSVGAAHAPLTVSSLSPAHGPARGGDVVDIVGTGFGSAPSVRFGETPAVVRASDDAHVSVVVPPGVAGAVDVHVTADGANADLARSYTYDALPLLLVDVTTKNVVAYPANGAGLAVFDVNGDRAPDVVQAAGTEGLWVYVNDGKGNFAAPRLVALAKGTDAHSLAAADFDGDGNVDLWVGTSSATTNVLLVGDGKGGFVPTKLVEPALVGTNESLAAADLDGDGDSDLVLVGVGATSKDAPNVAVLVNDRGTFTDVTKKLAGEPFAATGVAIGDVDGDGDLDLFFGEDKETSRLYVNDGKGTFQHASPDALPTDALGAGIPAFGDLDGNGTLDLYVPSSGQDHYLSNDGTGIFTDLSTLVLGQEATDGASATLVDFDMDGRLDVAVVDRAGQLRVYRNDASKRLFDYSDEVVGSMAGVSNVALAIADFDGDGDRDVFASRGDLAPPALVLNAAPIATTDTDGDGVPDAVDDCPAVADPSQDNLDSLPMHCYSASSCKAGTGCAFYARGGSAYLVCGDARSWADAEARCRAFDAHLARIDDADESAYVGGIGGSEAWIGLSDTATAGSWVWTTGGPSTFTNWAPTQPDGPASATCVRILPDGTWDNVPCSETRGYVCETARTKKPDPGDACDPCPLVYDPQDAPLVGPEDDEADASAAPDGDAGGFVCVQAP